MKRKIMNTANMLFLLAVMFCAINSLAQKATKNYADTTSITSNTKNKIQMTSLTTYLLFDGTCEQAMKFYQSCIGGELFFTKVGDSPMKNYFPESMHNKLVNARLVGESIDISASDWLRPNETAIHGNTVCLYLRTGTAAQLKAIFGKLSEGANDTEPLQQQPFGLYGALNDQFGNRWMFLTTGEN